MEFGRRPPSHFSGQRLWIWIRINWRRLIIGWNVSAGLKYTISATILLGPSVCKTFAIFEIRLNIEDTAMSRWENWPWWFRWWRIVMMTILCWCWEEWIIWWTNMANYAKSSCNRAENGFKPQLNCIVAALVHFGWDCSQCIVLHRIC